MVCLATVLFSLLFLYKLILYFICCDKISLSKKKRVINYNYKNNFFFHFQLKHKKISLFLFHYRNYKRRIYAFSIINKIKTKQIYIHI